MFKRGLSANYSHQCQRALDTNHTGTRVGMEPIVCKATGNDEACGEDLNSAVSGDSEREIRIPWQEKDPI